jgi:hypothetical protein
MGIEGDEEYLLLLSRSRALSSLSANRLAGEMLFSIGTESAMCCKKAVCGEGEKQLLKRHIVSTLQKTCLLLPFFLFLFFFRQYSTTTDTAQRHDTTLIHSRDRNPPLRPLTLSARDR